MAQLNGNLNARRVLSGELYGGIATGTFNYNELENKPSLNGNVLEGNVTLSIPDKTSDLTNDSGYITLSDIPTIPDKTSQLINDSGFITSAAIPDKTSDLTNDSGYITSADIPTKTSDLTNDSGFITSNEAPVQSVNGRSGDVTIFVPSTTSQITNDSGFITSSDIPVTSVNTKTGAVVLDGTDIEYTAGVTVNNKIDAIEASIPTIPVESVNGKTGAVVLDGTDIEYSVGVTVNSKIDAVEASIPTVPVDSVNGQTGVVVLDGADIEYSAGVTVNSKIDAVESSIPTVPTKTSDLTNDSGFISSDSNNPLFKSKQTAAITKTILAGGWVYLLGSDLNIATTGYTPIGISQLYCSNTNVVLTSYNCAFVSGSSAFGIARNLATTDQSVTFQVTILFMRNDAF